MKWIVLFLSWAAFECAAADKHWVDQALLHDGRTIDVQRTVAYTFGRGEVTDAFRKWPNQFSLSATNPDTRKPVKWSGEKDSRPVLLDFLDGVAYLVVHESSVFSNLKQYGCPEIPYIFFRNEGGSRWKHVAAKEFPRQLLRANLSPSAYNASESEHRTKEQIAYEWEGPPARLRSDEYPGREIPVDFASWKYKSKNQYRVSHHYDGCRHTVPSNDDASHPQWRGQPAQTVDLEILDTKAYDPEWVIKGDTEEWNAIAFSKPAYQRCQSLIVRVGDAAEDPTMRGWLLFANDPTRTRKARETGMLFCNAEAMWFADFAVAPGYLTMSKFTIAGEFLYRLQFAKVDLPGGFLGGPIQPVFRAEGGYLYFEWWNTRQSGRDRIIKQTMKVRVKEPKPA